MDTHTQERLYMSTELKVGYLRYFVDKNNAVEAESIELLTDGGIVGDSHFGPGDRQVAIMSSEGMAEVAGDLKKGLCYKRYKPNIAIDGFSVKGLKKGHVIKIGEAELEITMFKECFPKECELPGQRFICPLRRSAAFAKVVKDGTVKIGDEVTV